MTLGVLAMAAGLVVGVTGLVGTLAPAGAEPIASCSTTSGVIVAVDFGPWGGDVERGCAATPTTGYEALLTAGFSTTGDEHDGPGFVCRIDTLPSPTQTACVDTPPASGYWSFWHADAGQTTWTYSEEGAMTYRPPPGSVTAWTFGSGADGGAGKPPFSPSEVRADNATPPGPTTTSTSTTTPAPDGVPGPTSAGATTSTAPASAVAPATGPGAGGPTGGTTTTTTTTAAQSAGAAGARTGTGSSASTTTTTTADPAVRTGKGGAEPASGTPRIVDVAPASASAARKKSSGSSLTFALGAAVALALVASGAMVARRRRRAG